MLERLAQLLEEKPLLPPHTTQVVAVSGGVDSMVLMDLLSRLAKSWGWTLIIAHLDHAQRPGSLDVAMRVGAAADSLGHKFVTHRLWIPEGQRSSEADLRDRRYAWLREMRTAHDAATIVTAHHANDRLETAVWHAIRGSGRHGLTSLREEQRDIVRPLLQFRRGDIFAYAHQRGLDWDEDPSNGDTDYTRNLIRHELLGKAPEWDPHYHQNLSDWLDHLERLNDHADDLLEQLLNQTGESIEGGYSFDMYQLQRLSPAILAELIVYAARRLYLARGITKRNVMAAVDWLLRAPTGSYTEALPGLLLIREYDRVNLVASTAPVRHELIDDHLPLVAEAPVAFGRFKLRMLPSAQALDEAYHLKAGEYYVRRWQSGDRVKPIGMAGSKKVQDIFVDKKIPRRDRMIWPLIVSGSNDIALIPGLVRDRRYAAVPDQDTVAVEVKGE